MILDTRENASLALSEIALFGWLSDRIAYEAPQENLTSEELSQGLKNRDFEGWVQEVREVAETTAFPLFVITKNGNFHSSIEGNGLDDFLEKDSLIESSDCYEILSVQMPTLENLQDIFTRTVEWLEEKATA